MTTEANASYLENLDFVCYANSGISGTPDHKGGGGNGPKRKPKPKKAVKKK